METFTGLYGSLTLSGNNSMTINPGIYTIVGGGFAASGNAKVSESGVLIFNAGSNFLGSGSTLGAITISGNAAINLTAGARAPNYAGGQNKGVRLLKR